MLDKSPSIWFLTVGALCTAQHSFCSLIGWLMDLLPTSAVLLNHYENSILFENLKLKSFSLFNWSIGHLLCTALVVRQWGQQSSRLVRLGQVQILDTTTLDSLPLLTARLGSCVDQGGSWPFSRFVLVQINIIFCLCCCFPHIFSETLFFTVLQTHV